MANTEELVKRFVDSYYLIHTYIDEGNTAAAHTQYQRLLAAYNDIAAAPIAKYHKEIAHGQLTKVYNHLRQMNSSGEFGTGFAARTPAVLAAVLVIILSFIIVFKPSVIGLVSLEHNQAPGWEGPTVFEINGHSTINLSQFFYDPDGDSLVFVSTGADAFEISVLNEMVDILPKANAPPRSNITFIATDFADITKVPVSLIVKR